MSDPTDPNPTNPLEHARQIARAVTRRLEHPKRGQARDFSHTDREEILGSVIEALAFTPFFRDGGKMDFERWKACFRAARRTLRLDRIQESSLAESLGDTLAAMPAPKSHDGRAKLSRTHQRRVRYILACLRAGVSGRQAAHQFRANRDFLLSALALDRGNIPLNPDAFSIRKTRLLEILARGEKSLTELWHGDSASLPSPISLELQVRRRQGVTLLA